MKRPLFVALIHVIVFLSGIAGLIYQVAWQKYLSRLLGSDSIATAIILAAFLGGLSFGYYLCGKFTLNKTNHIKVYAILEGIIGVWALVFPSIFAFVESSTRSWSFLSPFWMIFQGGLCSIVLMGIPTVCMGGTMPFLTRGISKTLAESTNIHARIYSINTAGAFLGTLLAGFYLVPSFGLPVTIMGTGILNLFAFLALYLLSFQFSPGTPDDEQHRPQQAEPPVEHSAFPVVVLYLVAFLSGCYVMTFENILIRIISLSIGSSSYSFSLLVAVFILAIAVGSHVVSRYQRISSKTLCINQAIIALAFLLVYLSLDSWPYWAHIIRISCQSNISGFWLYYVVLFCVLTFVLIIPVSCAGATLPLLFHERKRAMQSIGRESGMLFSWNTVGNLCGSLIGGILLFSLLDNAQIYLVGVSLAALSALLLLWFASRRMFWIGVALSAALILVLFTYPAYNKRHFMTSTFREYQALPFSFSGPNAFFEAFHSKDILEYYKDGATATVAVVSPFSLSMLPGVSKSIIVNGKSDSSTFIDTYTLKLLAHLPALLAERRDEVMVIGLGTGVTAGELTRYPDIRTIDIAEISPEVVEALPHFRGATYNLEHDARARIHLGDAFRILGRSAKRWDIIISEPTNPWTSGVELLFTQEFYQLIKTRLTDKGMLVQWIQAYSSNDNMFGMMLNTLRQEFQYIYVFMADYYTDMLVLASNTPISNEQLAKAEMSLSTNPEVSASLKAIHLETLDAILLRQVWGPEGISKHFAHFGIQTMDEPVLHYMAGKSFFLNEHVAKTTLFSDVTAFYPHDFLLANKYENWSKFPMTLENVDALLRSTVLTTTKAQLPMGLPLKIKAYLHDPVTHALSEAERQQFQLHLLPFMTTPHLEKIQWEPLGWQDDTFRDKATRLLQQLERGRSWIVQYPLDGLKALLRQGLANAEDAYEKNWCGLQLARILLLEQAQQAEIDAVIQQLARTNDGQLLIEPSDIPLFEAVQRLLQQRT